MPNRQIVVRNPAHLKKVLLEDVGVDSRLVDTMVGAMKQDLRDGNEIYFWEDGIQLTPRTLAMQRRAAQGEIQKDISRREYFKKLKAKAAA